MRNIGVSGVLLKYPDTEKEKYIRLHLGLKKKQSHLLISISFTTNRAAVAIDMVAVLQICPFYYS